MAREQTLIVDAEVEVVADKSKKKWIQISVVIAIVVVVVGIFFFKTMQYKKNGSQAETSTMDIEANDSANDTAETPLKITKTDLEEIKAYGMPTVIDFGSDSCIPCKKMAPILETLNAEWQGKAIVQFMDVWKYSDGVSDFPVSVIPTQVFFNADGTPFVPSDELASQIEFTMYSDKEGGAHVFTIHQGGVTEEQMRAIFKEMGVE